MTEHVLPHAEEAARHAPRSRVQYLVAFGVLVALTLVELGVASTGGIPRTAAVVALVSLAIAKAALIALFYMHLRYETRFLQVTVLGPLVVPAIYGLLLMAETGWRYLR
jgi:caa(3)-type oxidase subunit IV